MDGRPVWLASASLRDRRGDLIATDQWSKSARGRVERQLLVVLHSVGDRTAERLFRMNVTLCIHRALTAGEEAGLRQDFCDAPALDLAGGPIEILRENVAQRASTRPCEQPGHGTIDPFRPDLWFPIDCGQCEPCRARAQIGSYAPAR